MVLGGGDFRMWLDDKVAVLMNGTSAYMKETPGNSLALLPPVKDTTGGELPINQKASPHQTLNLPVSLS